MDERGRQDEEFAGHIQPFFVHEVEKLQILLGYLDDGNIENIDFLRSNEVQQHVEGAFELVQLEAKKIVAGALAQTGRGCRREGRFFGGLLGGVFCDGIAHYSTGLHGMRQRRRRSLLRFSNDGDPTVRGP